MTDVKNREAYLDAARIVKMAKEHHVGLMFVLILV